MVNGALWQTKLTLFSPAIGQTINILRYGFCYWICKYQAIPTSDSVSLTKYGLQDMSIYSSTASLRSSILRNMEENGRKYHGYKEGKYVLPVDEVRFKVIAFCDF